MRNTCCINMADAPRDHAAERRSNAVAKEPAQLPRWSAELRPGSDYLPKGLFPPFIEETGNQAKARGHRRLTDTQEKAGCHEAGKVGTSGMAHKDTPPDEDSHSQVFPNRDPNDDVRTRPAPSKVAKIENCRRPRVFRTVQVLYPVFSPRLDRGGERNTRSSRRLKSAA